jgi:ElaB/YqjD/DUF883 family membrane-anchored ribosome-binding protein
MADSGIYYDFSSNHQSLDDITGMSNQIHEVKDDIHSIFQTLGTVYEGSGAEALNQAHIHLNNQLDEALNQFVNTQHQASEQQMAMQQIDAMNAADF